MKTTAKRAKPQHAGVSDEAVAQRTGKRWSEWFRLLDRAGAKRLDHAAIASLLHAKHRVSGWWSQMITVAWEQARGRRVRHQKAAGDFEVAASRTIAASRAAIWRAITNAAARRRWVAVPAWSVRTQRPPERVRIDWPGGQIVEFRIDAPAAGRSRVTAQHLKLRTAKAAAWTKRCWARALDRMQALLEK
jgi:hypothetical protein